MFGADWEQGGRVLERTWLEGMNVVDNGGLCAGERKPVCKGAWCAGKSVGEDWQHTAAASTIFAALHDVKAWTILGEMDSVRTGFWFVMWCGVVFKGA